MTFKGRTALITGASRGIGRAIALKLASSGANIVVAAKSAEPHPKLPGTIHSVADEIKALGGQALPVQTDVRSEEDVKNLVDSTIAAFGSIDILINNAGTVNLDSIENTPLKRYDLMHQVNQRATFLCTQTALPYLKKGNNPHILNLCPPINLKSKWLKSHLPYTLSKYGMSLSTLGMAEEFKPYGIAVNGLWPRTIIATAAIDMLMGEQGKRHCRTPDILADAAVFILQKQKLELTGQLLTDEHVLKNENVHDLTSYAVEPTQPLMTDLFIDANEGELDASQL